VGTVRHERWIDDGIASSIVPSRSQLGIVFHAGGPEGAVKALNTAGPCVASTTAPSFAGRSLANPCRKTLGFTYSSASPGAAPGNGTKLNTVFGGPARSTEPGWLESRPTRRGRSSPPSCRGASVLPRSGCRVRRCR
jgi:hypothetical protein